MYMEVKTFRAKSMREALQRVRTELGPDAAVLTTREIRPSAISRVFGKTRQIEVTASLEVNVPTRIPSVTQHAEATPQQNTMATTASPGVADVHRFVPSSDQASGGVSLDLSTDAGNAGSFETTQRFEPVFARQSPLADSLASHSKDSTKTRMSDVDVCDRLGQLQSMVDQLRHGAGTVSAPELPDGLFELFTDLIEGDVGEEVARDLVERAHRELSADELADKEVARRRVLQLIENEIHVAGPIQATPGKRRLVALVGPTGVGKTTTIAKLAADFRLRQRLRVGLITVDTYRIAAVDQLQTYADIIDLPMEVVSTPREMRAAIDRLGEMDLILMDTAGRSPRDEVKIQELKSMLGEAEADEVHLVLSATTGASNLVRTAERFSKVGSTSLILTKLDETTSLGNLLPLVRQADLPLSYVTNGQNVPDDIEAADPQRLAGAVLGDV